MANPSPRVTSNNFSSLPYFPYHVGDLICVVFALCYPLLLAANNSGNFNSLGTLGSTQSDVPSSHEDPNSGTHFKLSSSPFPSQKRIFKNRFETAKLTTTPNFRLRPRGLRARHVPRVPPAHLLLEDRPQHLPGGPGAPERTCQDQPAFPRPTGEQEGRQVDLRLHRHPVLTTPAGPLQGPALLDRGRLPLSPDVAPCSPLLTQGTRLT